jgi:Lrp/AsnC family transcriptional regulator for asnA, asnC and gidA
MAQPDQSLSSAVSLDNLDRDIISLLKVDGRISYKDIAKQLNVPDATARYRVQRLLQSDLIQIQAWPNPKYFGVPHVGPLSSFRPQRGQQSRRGTS